MPLTWHAGDPTGLAYAGARYLDPGTGRFLSEDPVPALNPTAYVSNDPLNRWDPDGRLEALEAGLAQSTIAVPEVGVGTAVGLWLSCELMRAASIVEAANGGVSLQGLPCAVAIPEPNAHPEEEPEPDDEPRPGPQPDEQPDDDDDDQQSVYWIVYEKYNAFGLPTAIRKGGRVYPAGSQQGWTYAGLASGSDSCENARRRRDSGHHKNAWGYGPARIVACERSIYDDLAKARRAPFKYADPAYQAIEGMSNSSWTRSAERGATMVKSVRSTRRSAGTFWTEHAWRTVETRCEAWALATFGPRPIVRHR